MSASAVERARDKLFANTYCIGEPPDVQIAINYFYETINAIPQRDRQGAMWRIEQLPTVRYGRGMYFQASTEYLSTPVYQGVNGILRCTVAVQADHFDDSGRHCFNAYPLHVNFAFSDSNLWQIPYAESLVGYTLHMCERTFRMCIGLPPTSDPNSGRFELQEGMWNHEAPYP